MAPMGFALRASDADRERVAQFLMARHGEGYLSLDTFSNRVGSAYRAQTSDELNALVADLPQRPPGPLLRMVETLRVGVAGAAHRDEPAPLPWLSVDASDHGALGRGRFVLGRSWRCDFPLPDTSVSRHHAELRFGGGRWAITDLDSTNGVFINGCRVTRDIVVAGDEIALGASRMLFRPRDAVRP